MSYSRSVPDWEDGVLFLAMLLLIVVVGGAFLGFIFVEGYNVEQTGVVVDKDTSYIGFPPSTDYYLIMNNGDRVDVCYETYRMVGVGDEVDYDERKFRWRFW